MLLIQYFKSRITQKSLTYVESNSAVQSIIIPGNDNVKAIAKMLNEKKFDVRPIMSPTVPVGKERLRICLHAFNQEEEINQLIDLTP